MSIRDSCWLRYVNGGTALWRLAFEVCGALERLRGVVNERR